MYPNDMSEKDSRMYCRVLLLYKENKIVEAWLLLKEYFKLVRKTHQSLIRLFRNLELEVKKITNEIDSIRIEAGLIYKVAFECTQTIIKKNSEAKSIDIGFFENKYVTLKKKADLLQSRYKQCMKHSVCLRELYLLKESKQHQSNALQDEVDLLAEVIDSQKCKRKS